jgi:3-deoxy-manno-octulosonate cytidylyltransferase (CMP-KDO synthetase)
MSANTLRPLAVIPSRFASVRFPGKPLALLAGKPMIQHVFERCQESRAFSEIIVATEDERILRAVEGFGGRALLTSPSCASGTDRVAEIARALPHASHVVNVQGDEPLVHPESLGLLAQGLQANDVEMATLIRPLKEEERANPNVVKVVLSARGNALYFSRADLPHARDPKDAPAPRYGHLGLYGYRRETLLKLAALPPTPLEQTEKLEQLRALENEISIRCFTTPHTSLGVDTPEDLAKAETLFRERVSH